MKRVFIALLSLIFILLLFNGCSSGKSINLNDYFNVTFDGANTLGRASVDVDLAKLEGDISGSGELSADQLGAILNFEIALNYNLDKTDNLSNGDNVKLTITYSGDAAKALKLKVTGVEQSYTVENLKDLVPIDLFDGVKVSFSGIAPFATIKIEKNSNDKFLSTYVNYSPSKKDNLNVGEKITVIAECNEDNALNSGYIISENTKEYTVENVDAYIKDYSLIESNTEMTDKLKKESLDLAIADLAQNTNSIFYKATGDSKYSSLFSTTTYSAPELHSIYYFDLKDGENTYSELKCYNMVCLIYKTHMSYTGSQFNKANGEIDAYIAISLPDFIQRPDGTLEVKYSEKKVQGYYDTEDKLDDKLIKVNRDVYEIANVS